MDIHIDNPELVVFGGLLAIVALLAGTTGYVVMAIAFVREHRRKAAADWRRAHEEWERVEHSRWSLEIAQRAAEEKTQRVAAEKAAFLHRYMNEGVTTEAEARTAAEEYFAGMWSNRPGERIKEPQGLAALIKCIDPGCPAASEHHTLRDHVTLDGVVFGLRNPTECVDPTCPSADTEHSHPLIPKEGT